MITRLSEVKPKAQVTKSWLSTTRQDITKSFENTSHNL